MSDLISRQETLFILSNLNSAWVGYEKVSRLPTIDAVPVVRCKDCKHGDKENGQYYCHYTGETWNDGNFYCAGGERKDDE